MNFGRGSIYRLHQTLKVCFYLSGAHIPKAVQSLSDSNTYRTGKALIVPTLKKKKDLRSLITYLPARTLTEERTGNVCRRHCFSDF